MFEGTEGNVRARIDVYVHLADLPQIAYLVGLREGGSASAGFDPRSGQCSRGGCPERQDSLRQASRRPIATLLVTAVVVLGVGFVSYRAGSLESGENRAAVASRTVSARAPTENPPQPNISSQPKIPPALARDLGQAPRVIPPPGAPADAGAATGPAAFGLGN